MYGGRDESVTVRVINDKVGIFLDRFGKDISIFKADVNHVDIRFKAAISGQFFGWIFGLGEDVTIIGPKSVVDEAKEIAKKLYSQYK